MKLKVFFRELECYFKFAWRKNIVKLKVVLPAAGGGLSTLFDAAGGGISTLSPLTARSLVSMLLNRWLKVIDVQCSATFGLPSSPSFWVVLKKRYKN